MPNTNGFARRDFLKAAGIASLAGLTLPAINVIGRIGDYEYVTSPEEYGGFLVRRLAPGGAKPYQVDDSKYQRFNEKNEVFSRVIWDPEVKNVEAPYAGVPQEHVKRNDLGFTRLDYAFYTASWTVAVTLGNGAGAIGGANDGMYSWAPLPGSRTAPYATLPKWEPTDWPAQEVSNIVKKTAKFYGASLSGIAELDERWIYSHRYTKGYSKPPNIEAPIIFDDVDAPKELDDKTLVIPKSMKYVIALAFEMDRDGYETVISGPGSAATGNGYSRMTFTAACLAEFIRALGYQAIPSGNCTGLSVPIAIDAGLGEVGRHGLLITPKYGSRVRLAKVITDMPLMPDTPIAFGSTEFCEVCSKCADNCPGEAILKGPNARTYEARNISNNPGVYKWPVDCVKCHLVWAQNGMDCATCIRVCPFNKPETWLHDATRALIGARSGAVDQTLIALDNASGYGDQQNPRDFWKKDNFVHIKA